jgi:phenylacetate-CoA ligase
VIFEPAFESLPREELQALQLERLRALVVRLRERVPIYAERLAGVEPGDVRSLDDLRLLPFTRKDDLRDTYPLGMLAVPREKLARIHASSGTTGKLTLIEDLRPDVIACTPSYALTLAQAFRERGVAPGEISLRCAVVGAEPWTERMREEIDAGLGVRCANIFGLSEVIGPGVSCECLEERAGSHVNEDHFLPEIVDAESGERVAEGEEGVLVFTTLTKEALPLVRYWTGDICSLSTEPCSCGRTTVRMGPIVGRSDDMLVVRGVNVYPSQVGSVIGRIPELSPHFGLVLRREGTLDEVEVLAEVSDAELLRDGTELQSRVSSLIRDTIGCTMAVTLVGPGEAPRSDGGKIQRVRDLR